MKPDPNITMLERIAAALGPLRSRMVLLGGCATGLLLTDPAAVPIRATRDVDLIVETQGRPGYLKVEKELTRCGFRPDQTVGAPLCRWTLDDLFVDVMPTDPSILGFTNRWYPEALQTSWQLRLPSGLEISVVSPPAFLATKLEAFYGRGQGDFVASHDMEDFVSVVDGREGIDKEVRVAHDPVRSYLSTEIGQLLTDRTFLSSLQGHLAPDAGSQSRLPILLQRLRAIAARL